MLWKRLLHGADAVVPCSREIAEALIRIDPASAERIQVIHNAVDPERLLAEERLNPSLPEDLRGRRYVLSVASFEPRKGHDILLAAFGRIAAALPDIDLVLVGARASLSPQLDEMIERFELHGRVFVYEDVAHVHIPAFLKNALVFALASRYEGLPLVLLEAGVFGLSVVATRVGGIPELVVDGENGLLIEFEDVAALADRLAFVLDDPDERARLGSNLHRTVQCAFTWQQAYRRVVQLIDGMDRPARSAGIRA
jgi:glycosyltransferase involved in cell wall biosynthesis